MQQALSKVLSMDYFAEHLSNPVQQRCYPLQSLQDVAYRGTEIFCSRSLSIK